jgi:hypothetical protein
MTKKNLVLAVPNAVIFYGLLFFGDDHRKKGRTCVLMNVV